MKKRALTRHAPKGAVLLSGLLLASGASTHEELRQTPTLTPHIGDLESAAKAALERNAPTLIHIILEGEEHNDLYRDEILTDKELIKLSEACVVIISNNGEHKQKIIKEKIDGVSQERSACSSFPMFSNCDGHRKTWNPLYHEYQDESGDMGCPQTIVLSPSGEIDWRHNIRNPPATSEVAAALKAAQKKYGKSLTKEELRTIKAHVAAGKKAEGAGEWAAAWTRYEAILSIISIGNWAALAKPGQERASKAIGEQLSALEKRFKPGEVATPWRELVALREATRETPFKREVAAFTKKIERDKALKDDIKAIKTEMEAEALWDEADGLLRRGEERKAMKLLKKINGKKFNGTATQARIRERFPELNKD